MRFKSVDESNNFSFKDCELIKTIIGTDGINCQVEALIVKPENSQNTNFTESYAGTAEIRFVNGSIISGMKDGYKYYNADDVLIDEVPDTDLSTEDISSLLKNLSAAYLYDIKKDNDIYTVCIELADKDNYNAALDSYTIKIKADKFIVEWDIYMNRVQH